MCSLHGGLVAVRSLGQGAAFKLLWLEDWRARQACVKSAEEWSAVCGSGTEVHAFMFMHAHLSRAGGLAGTSANPADLPLPNYPNGGSTGLVLARCE